MSLSAGRDINFTTANRSHSRTACQPAAQQQHRLSRLGPLPPMPEVRSAATATSVFVGTAPAPTSRPKPSAPPFRPAAYRPSAGATPSCKRLPSWPTRTSPWCGRAQPHHRKRPEHRAQQQFLGQRQERGSSAPGRHLDWATSMTSEPRRPSATTSNPKARWPVLLSDVTLVGGNECRRTASSVLAAGQAGPLGGRKISNILAKNVTINEAYNTEQTVSMQRGSSSKLGGSASFMGVSTDSLGQHQEHRAQRWMTPVVTAACRSWAR